MVGFIDRDEVRQFVDDQDAVVAEVLPRAEYDWAHLPGAIHLPLKGWKPEQIAAGLDRDRPGDRLLQRLPVRHELPSRVPARQPAGPTAVRPSEELVPLVERRRQAEVDAGLMARSDGRLLGLLEGQRGEQAIEEA